MDSQKLLFLKQSFPLLPFSPRALVKRKSRSKKWGLGGAKRTPTGDPQVKNVREIGKKFCGLTCFIFLLLHLLKIIFE